MDSITIYTDGSFDPHSKRAAWAFVVAGETPKISRGLLADADTSQHCELAAIVAAVAATRRGVYVTVATDQLDLIARVEAAKPASRRWSAAMADLYHKLLRLISRRCVRLLYVRSHAGTRCNELAHAAAYGLLATASAK